MKIKKNIENKKYKLLKFNLITIKIIKKIHIKKNLLINDVEARLKKALKLIYIYHINNKKIIFIGNPLNINKKLIKLLRTTKHMFVPKSTWISGLITNKKSIKKVLKLKKIDLVVIIDKKNEIIALEESYSFKLPIITLNCDLNPFDSKSSYKIPGNLVRLKDKLRNNFFYLLLLSTLRKAEKIKKQCPFLSYKPGNLRAFQHMKRIRRNLWRNPDKRFKKKKSFQKNAHYYGLIQATEYTKKKLKAKKIKLTQNDFSKKK